MNVFFDPTGKHLIISTELGINYYLYSTWKKTKQLAPLKVNKKNRWNKWKNIIIVMPLFHFIYIILFYI